MSMYSEKMERLIELALADGVLTDKEREVLIKKAIEEGIDKDEFEMVLDGRLAEQNKKSAPVPPPPPAPAPPPQPRPASNKQGSLVKCPSCGAVVPPMTAVCADCGHEFRNVEAVQSAQLLFEALQDVERRKAETLRANPRNVNAIDNQFHKEKLSVIRTFPVPNSKEDLIEMLAMTTSNAYDNDGVVGVDEEAWLQKTDQVYQKIVLTFGNDTETLKRATTMVASLMRRLPKNYKNFTNLPASMREHALAETDMAKKQLNDYRNQKTKELLTSPMALGGLGGLLIGIILFIVGGSTNSDGLVIIGLLLAIVGFILTRKVYKEFKEVRKSDGFTV